jgi:DNA uptake protein ComE-like DNA-binding protein
MNRSRIPALIGATALFVAVSGCRTESREDAEAADTTAAAGAPAAGAPAGPAPAQASGDTTPVGAFLDPDAATREQLLALPGMDSAAANALVAGRPYADMRAVDRVLTGHLTERERDSVYARLWKPIDLNTASGEEILLIPGVGPRMRHEFEEYRPYRSIEQFRREIGKYVDAQEVARLERYVTIR